MRVALTFPGCHRRGGVERVILECANFLAQRGHDVHLFASEWDDVALAPAVHRHAVKINALLPLGRVRNFPRVGRRAMQTSGVAFDAHGAFGIMSPPGGTIWVQSVHAQWLEICRQQRTKRARIKQALNPYHRLVLHHERSVFGERQYRRLIALTDQVRDDLVRHYHIPRADIDVLPNGFSSSEFSIARREQERELVRAELDLACDQRVVIFVANETERKGFDPLLRAIHRLSDPSLVLLAVGRLDASAYQEEIRRLGMAERVRFTGPTSDVGRFYAAADVFALPTQYEAWGLVIVEAMASGLPALTSRLAGAAAAVHEGKTGELLEDPRDVAEIASKLGRLLAQHHEDASAISRSVQQYRWSEILGRYESILAGEHTGIRNRLAG